MLVSRALVSQMKPCAVIVDVAIDQGGCIASPPDGSHAAPTYLVSGVVHYCVTNMPGAVARTSTLALTNAMFPYAKELANKGYRRAALEILIARARTSLKGKWCTASSLSCSGCH